MQATFLDKLILELYPQYFCPTTGKAQKEYSSVVFNRLSLGDDEFKKRYPGESNAYSTQFINSRTATLRSHEDHKAG